MNYDQVIEVTPQQLAALRANAGGLFCWRREGERILIKWWMMKYKRIGEAILNIQL